MVEINFFSDSNCSGLYPLNLGRCESTLHYGARSISAQWKEGLDSTENKRIILNSRVLPTEGSINAVLNLRPGDQWIYGGFLIAENVGLNEGKEVMVKEVPEFLENAAEIFDRCGEGIEADLERLKFTWRTRSLSEDERSAWAEAGVFVHGPMGRIHCAPGAVIRNCTLNTENGDVVLGPESEVMEGSRVRGPFVLGEGSQIRMGSLIYGPTTVGAKCKVGGEVSNSVFHDYSNKAHGGFVGNSVIGSWCNLGAETSTSNLKNNYSEIKVWDERSQSLENSGRLFCGLLMGDHSKTAIHTAFNTGSVVGAFCNVFGLNTPEKHLKSFSWGEADVHQIDKAIDTAKKVMKRRGIEMSAEQEASARELFKSSR